MNMVMNKKLRVSLVIPAYNEERHLRRSLDAIARQTVAPYEVIVVDNNSSDKTAVIAAEYPFVTVIAEPRQGVVFARNAGFNAARGDVIGRIDSDTTLDPNWVEMVQTIFAESDLDAVSGSVRYDDFIWTGLASWIDLQCRRHLADKLGREVYLFGSNMALRRSAWRYIQDDLCNSAKMHEDFDLAIHLTRRGGVVAFDERLHAGISLRRTDTSLRSFYHYAMMSPRTYAQHRLSSRWHMYPVVTMVLFFYLPMRALHRGYDPVTKQFSWKRMLTEPVVNRVDPTLHHESLLK